MTFNELNERHQHRLKHGSVYTGLTREEMDARITKLSKKLNDEREAYWTEVQRRHLEKRKGHDQ
jgi:hypothetical protein